MSDLKPCPFCGCHAEISETRLNLSASVLYTVSCTNKKDCFRAEFSSFTEETAIKYWNTRPVEDKKDKEIERLKGALDSCRYFANNSINCFNRYTQNDLMEMFYTIKATAEIALKDAPDTGKMEG